jgi:predicted metal-dependent hydrolase
MTTPMITIIRSRRRKKTIQTKSGKDHLWIYLPAGMPAKEEQKWIEKMIQRHKQWEQKQTLQKSDEWLSVRAEELNKKYFDGILRYSICFVTNQHSRYGSCTSMDKSIRISDQVKTMPPWVQDYIILHELTHLLYPDHSKKFWETVNQYKYAERAKGYLIALSQNIRAEETESPVEKRISF